MEEKNDILTCNCPLCGKQMRIRRPSKEGKYKYVCIHCKQSFALTYKEDPQQKESKEREKKQEECQRALNPIDSRYMTIGGLQECRKGLFAKNKIHSLHEGVITIGRRNVDCPSDIMLDDPTVSRRSLKLSIEKRHCGNTTYYTYNMTVQRTTNPVIYNGDALVEGDMVELRIDDTIILGKTKLILK